jgi:hypothetical protein
VKRGEVATFALLAVLGACGVAVTRPRLAAIVHDAGATPRDDVYLFPPPGVLKLLTLGYDAAAVDLLWSKLLVEYGTHWQEHRPFVDVPRYLDAVMALEPSYAPLYRFADTLLCYRPPVGTEADARLARKYLEAGAFGARKDDHEVWLEYGQFVAFIGPSFLSSDEEKDQWRRDGAKAIAHAVELGADPDSSLAAATILSRYGERDAAIRDLERILPLTDDPDTRQQIVLKLELLRESVDLGAFMTKDEISLAGVLYPDVNAIRDRVVVPNLAEMSDKLGGQMGTGGADAQFLTNVIAFTLERARADAEARQRTLKRIEEMWRASYPFLTRGELMIVGPERETARCAGRDARDDVACARDWDDALK